MDRETEDESSQMAAMFALDTWNKMMLIAGAAAAVAVTIFLVVCCVGDGCLLHDLITRNKRELTLSDWSVAVAGLTIFYWQERSCRRGSCPGLCTARGRRP